MNAHWSNLLLLQTLLGLALANEPESELEAIRSLVKQFASEEELIKALQRSNLIEALAAHLLPQLREMSSSGGAASRPKLTSKFVQVVPQTLPRL